MAERRMFAKSIINSARFLRMPQTSRLLYYDLGMAADDDGIVEAFTVIRTTGAAEDDLRVLASKGFIAVLNDDLVAYISDWTTNNQIRKDRYTPSIYSELLVKLNNFNDGSPTVNQMATNGIPIGNQRLPQIRLDNKSKDKESEGQKKSAAKPPVHARGQYGWVKLTDVQYAQLVADLGQEEADRCIAYVDECAQSTGNKNKWRDWNLTVRRCNRDGWGKQTKKPARFGYDINDPQNYNYEEGQSL